MTAFGEAIYHAAIYSPQQYAKDVLQVALTNMGVEGRKALENGIRMARQVPDTDGILRDTAIFKSLDYNYIEQAAQRLFGRVQKYEAKYGLDEVAPTEFLPTGGELIDHNTLR